ncbi:MAG: hypothetical protein K2M43_03245 [Mycoplasmoidaceae bacterium]|nr:hypothetical protein [Mycoplasmoidaceae bacterium]
MDYSFQTKFGEITISQNVVYNTIKKVVKGLSFYEVKDIKFEENVRGLVTCYLYLKNNNSSINYIDYIDKFQERLNRSISSSLNITNLFSVIILS